MKKLLIIFLVMSSTAHADGLEVVAGLDSQTDLVTVNENFRKKDAEINELSDLLEAGTSGQTLTSNGDNVAPSYQSATASNALSGSVVQVVNTQTGAVATGTNVIPDDDSIPQQTGGDGGDGEGDEYMTLAITPNNASNKLKIDVVVFGNANASGRIGAALFQDSTAGALAAGKSSGAAVDVPRQVSFTHYMTAGTTSTTTFKVRAGDASGTFTFNGEGAARKYGGVMASSITITEVKV